MPFLTTALVAGGIAAAGGLGSAAIGAHAAGEASKTQSNAALTAAQLEHDSSQQALNFQKQQYATSQSEFAPWLQSGQSALANLNYLLGIGPNSATTPSTAPGSTPASPGPAAAAMPAGPPARPAPGVQAGPSDLSTQPGVLHPGVPGGANPGQLQYFNATPTTGRPTAGVQAGLGDLATQPGALRPGVPGGAAPSRLQALNAAPAGYGGQSFQGLTTSGDPNVSPNQQTTAQWKAQGIPFQNITTPDGRTVAVRTDQPGPQASVAPPTGIQPSSASLVNPDLGAYGSLSKGWDQTFQAPTDVTEKNDPGYQFRIQQATNALQNSAAARGGLLTGGTARDLNDYVQNQASGEYGNVYNRALNTYGTNYNTFEANQTNQYNRLASLAGLGQQTASQLSMAGQNFANSASTNLLNSAAQQGQQLNNAAAATASGYVGGANAYGGALSGMTGNFSNLASLYALLNQGGGANPMTGGA